MGTIRPTEVIRRHGLRETSRTETTRRYQRVTASLAPSLLPPVQIHSSIARRHLMSKAVIGTTSTQAQAQKIIGELHVSGFATQDISVLFPDPKDTKTFAQDMETKVPDGAAIGAVTGGSAGAWLGGGLGFLTGIGAIVIPGLGPFLAVGPLLGLFGGAAVGATVGATVGTFTGVLVAMGIPEHQAKEYEARLGNGRILLSVHTEDRSMQWKAADVLRRNGSEDISYIEENKEPAPVAANLVM
jgi:hypothetical protein